MRLISKPRGSLWPLGVLVFALATQGCGGKTAATGDGGGTPTVDAGANDANAGGSDAEPPADGGVILPDGVAPSPDKGTVKRDLGGGGKKDSGSPFPFPIPGFDGGFPWPMPGRDGGGFPWPMPGRDGGGFPWPMPGRDGGGFPWPFPKADGGGFPFPFPFPGSDGGFPFPFPFPGSDGGFPFPFPFPGSDGGFPWPMPSGDGGFPFPLPFGDGGFPWPMKPGQGGPAWARSSSEVGDAFAAARGSARLTVRQLYGRGQGTSAFSVGATANVTVDPASRGLTFSSAQGTVTCRFDSRGADLALGNASSSIVYLQALNDDRSGCALAYDARSRRALFASAVLAGGETTIVFSGN